MALAEEKKLLRKEIKSRISEFIEAGRNGEASRRICRKVLELNEYKSATTIFAYIPAKNEADCMPFVEAALSEGKNVFVPRVHSGSCDMDFYELKKDVPVLDQLESGAFGIMEPKPELEIYDIDFPVPSAGTSFCASLDSPAEVFILVPGLAFTAEGKRLGKGKGFYDRYFERLEQAGVRAFLCGFCLPCQIVSDIPCDLLDVRMNKVVF
ncbi:MAG: 5-formyltetrahydrofolate cyclo-ligase [Treponema sp.]|nr:5-formyltetrahydrofolate cyclo-ligase [Candidatus Treponema equifaecale]